MRRNLFISIIETFLVAAVSSAGVWSSGMISALGADGLGFDSPLSPLLVFGTGEKRDRRCGRFALV